MNTPPPSAKGDSSVATVLSAPDTGAVASRETPLSTGTTGLTAPGLITLSISAQTSGLMSDDVSDFFCIRSHPRVKTLLSLFSVVEVVTVRVFVWQRRVFSSSEKGTMTHLIRFGVVPRAVVTEVKSTNVAHYLPYMRTMATSTNVGATAEAVFGDGGVPFPPGLQLDLRAVETRHNYPEVLLVNTNKNQDASFELCQAQLDITVRCSGQNFGALY